jgi:hypothetical protein
MDKFQFLKSRVDIHSKIIILKLQCYKQCCSPNIYVNKTLISQFPDLSLGAP